MRCSTSWLRSWAPGLPHSEGEADRVFWELVQRSQIGGVRNAARDVRRQALSLGTRVAMLQEELRHTQNLLVRLIERLERHFGEDFDGDGEVGRASLPPATNDETATP
jgi:hypothetical protein